MKARNNAHRDLLELIPSFYGNQQLMKEMFDEIMVSHPKAVVDAYKKIKVDTPLLVLQQIIYDSCGRRYPESQLQPIIDQYKNGKIVGATIKIRDVAQVGLREAKYDISNIFVAHPVFNKI